MITRKTCKMISLMCNKLFDNCSYYEDVMLLDSNDNKIIEYHSSITTHYSTDLCGEHLNLGDHSNSVVSYAGLDYITDYLEYVGLDTIYDNYVFEDVLYDVDFTFDFEEKYFQYLLLFKGSEGLYDSLVLRTFLANHLCRVQGHISITLDRSGDNLFEEEAVLKQFLEMGIPEREAEWF